MMGMKFSPPPKQTRWRRFRHTRRWYLMTLAFGAGGALLGAALTTYLVYIIVFWAFGAVIEGFVLALRLSSSEEVTIAYDAFGLLLVTSLIGGAVGGAIFRWLQQRLLPFDQRVYNWDLRRVMFGGAVLWAALVMLYRAAASANVLMVAMHSTRFINHLNRTPVP